MSASNQDIHPFKRLQRILRLERDTFMVAVIYSAAGDWPKSGNKRGLRRSISKTSGCRRRRDGLLLRSGDGTGSPRPE
jgi:hypothetical protein